MAKVTLKDVADYLGCSNTTVSLSLRGSPKISKATHRRVQEATAKLNYRPNLAARSLKRGRTNLVGIYSHFNDSVRVSLVNSLSDRLIGKGMRPLVGVASSFSENWDDCDYIKTFLELHVGAIAIVTYGVTDLPVWHHEVPVVLVGAHAGKECDCVLLDREEAGRKAMDYLVSQNVDEVVLPMGVSVGFARGCMDIIETKRFPYQIFDIYAPVDYITHKVDMMSLLDFIQKSSKRLGICFPDAENAARFLVMAEYAGIDIRKQICVVGYNYFPMADLMQIPLTTVEQPIEQLAQYATHVIENRINHPGSEFAQISLNHKLVVRA